MEKSNRAARRAATRRICDRRHTLWVTFSTVCSKQPGHWKKRNSLSCGCRKRRNGAPKRDVGLCDHGVRIRIYQNRALSRDLKRLSRGLKISALEEVLGHDWW